MNRATLAVVLALLHLLARCHGATTPACAAPIDSSSVTKFVDALPSPSSLQGGSLLTIGMHVIKQKLHRDLPPTTLYAFGTSPKTASYPGPTIRATQGQPTHVVWRNRLGKRDHLLPVDFSLAHAMDGDHAMVHAGHAMMRADNRSRPARGRGIPTVIHLHGGEVPPDADGNPNSWFTNNNEERGPTFVANKYKYPNVQHPATLWYHDHTMGMTRLNVYAGLAGVYIIDDGINRGLPSGKYDIPLVIQDKAVCADGSLYYSLRPFHNRELDQPALPSLWVPEEFGNLVLVNGKAWPFKNVERRAYRFRMLDATNARFLNLRFEDVGSHRRTSCAVIYQVAADGGYLDAPVRITPPFLMAPGERREMVVDFSQCGAGTKVIVRNNAASPFSGPNNFDDNIGDLSYVMQFRVSKGAAAAPFDPARVHLLGSLPSFPKVDVYRSMIIAEEEAMNELDGEEAPIELTLNGKGFDEPPTEFPREGDVEQWDFINLSEDTHPMHIHLVQFQVVARFKFVHEGCRCRPYAGMGPDPCVASCVNLRAPILPSPEERGWKDTVSAHPNEITRIRTRFAPVTSGQSTYPFDVSKRPGYVWHCHLLEHEDNDMMRPFMVLRRSTRAAR